MSIYAVIYNMLLNNAHQLTRDAVLITLPETFSFPPKNQLIFPLFISQSITVSNSFIHRSLRLAKSPQNPRGLLILSAYNSSWLVFTCPGWMG